MSWPRVVREPCIPYPHPPLKELLDSIGTPGAEAAWRYSDWVGRLLGNMSRADLEWIAGAYFEQDPAAFQTTLAGMRKTTPSMSQSD